jgi:hypothetical protein
MSMSTAPPGPMSMPMSTAPPDPMPTSSRRAPSVEAPRVPIYVAMMERYRVASRRNVEARFRQRLRRSITWSIAVVAMLVLCATASARNRDRDRDDDDDDGDSYDDEVELSVDVSRPIVTSASPLAPHAPPIAEVLEAAYEAAGLARDPTRSWSRRARVAGLIPWITARVGWDANWNDEEPDVGRSRTFEVRATWRLDRLLFDAKELQISSIDASRRRERRRLASRVIRIYFGWRRLTQAAAVDPKHALAAEAVTAELDALTNGWFSDRAKSAR